MDWAKAVADVAELEESVDLLRTALDRRNQRKFDVAIKACWADVEWLCRFIERGPHAAQHEAEKAAEAEEAAEEAELVRLEGIVRPKGRG